MLGYNVHDVAITPETDEQAPGDDWARAPLSSRSRLTCSCGYTDGPMLTRLAPWMARLHINAPACLTAATTGGNEPG